MNDANWDAFYDGVHATGLAHLKSLAETVESLRSAMADLPTGDQHLHYVAHLGHLSQTMLAWSHYLIPKERPAPGHCPDCVEVEDDDEDDL